MVCGRRYAFGWRAQTTGLVWQLRGRHVEKMSWRSVAPEQGQSTEYHWRLYICLRLLFCIEANRLKRRGIVENGSPRTETHFAHEVMLQIFFPGSWYKLFDFGADEAPCDIQSMRTIDCLELGYDAIYNETTILDFRHLLECHDLTKAQFEAVAAYLKDKGSLLRVGHGRPIPIEKKLTPNTRLFRLILGPHCGQIGVVSETRMWRPKGRCPSSIA